MCARENANLFALFAVLSRICFVGYTMDMSKSTQSVHGFLTFTKFLSLNSVDTAEKRRMKRA